MGIGKQNAVRLWVVAAASLLIAFETSGRPARGADDTIPRVITADRLNGPPIDELISIQLNDVLLHVPWAYMRGRPQQQVRNRLNNRKEFGFSFWMPDRRYTEFNLNSNLGFRPPEPGRGEPAPNAYVVHVSSLRPTNLDEPGYVSPQQAYNNQMLHRYPSDSKYHFQHETFGLVRFWPQDEPYPKRSDQYRHKDASDKQILLDCRVPDGWITPSCRGRVHLVSDNLAFDVTFPSEEVARWHDIVLAARELYTSWKVSP